LKFNYVGQLLRAELWKAYTEADVLAFPSLFEGFGLVILEAMINGTPVIATERTAAPDIYKHGDGGFLVESGKIENLTAAVSGLIGRPQLLAELGERAYEIARQFTWEAYRNNLIDFLTANG
jgi:glycosyltransferase involved in cell wall biosynthesis